MPGPGMSGAAVAGQYHTRNLLSNPYLWVTAGLTFKGVSINHTFFEHRVQFPLVLLPPNVNPRCTHVLFTTLS